jgi:hypothetical protein
LCIFEAISSGQIVVNPADFSVNATAFVRNSLALGHSVFARFHDDVANRQDG